MNLISRRLALALVLLSPAAVLSAQTVDEVIAKSVAASGGRAALPLSANWAIFGQGLFSALVARPRFVLDGVGELYRPPAWGLRFSLGAEWRQP